MMVQIALPLEKNILVTERIIIIAASTLGSGLGFNSKLYTALKTSVGEFDMMANGILYV
jgi:hypothetical protein